MRIAVAGASGVIGRSLIPMLVGAGHEVTGLIRNPDYACRLDNQGAKSFVVDVFDRQALFQAMSVIKPEVTIHQLTSLSGRDFVANARIRREGTRNLVDASLEAGVRRMIAQSISWAYVHGDGPAAEDSPLDWDAPPPRGATVAAVHALETAVAEMPEYVILRYGLLYGAGTWYAPNELMADLAAQGRLPATNGISSFVHVEDAARAALLALHWPSGAYNIVDNEPAAGTEWLPAFAAAAGAPEPAVEPGSARGERGALNGKALNCGWEPKFGTWRTGFRELFRTE
jgi:nucleoside-diphosphate-sugar epimerase